MSERFQHLGWAVSPYSAKTRAHLVFKGILFDDVEPSARALVMRVRRAVGQAIMPTVITPEGQWLQDSSEIIDELETRFPEPSITPPGPRQRIASLLFELHGDEWLPTPAMHFRWNLPENAAFAIREFGRSGFPWLPAPLRARAAKPFADKMKSYRPILGVTPETHAGIESFSRELIARLDVHLAEHDFLLGSRPCLGDFALFGPLWAHLYRDPASTELFRDAPHVRAWIDRLRKPSGDAGCFLANDEVPSSLDAILRTLFEEQGDFLQELIAAINRWCDENPEATRVPRSLGNHAFSIGGAQGTRRLITATQWMAQRPLGAYAALGDSERGAVDTWLEDLGGLDLLRTPILHPFERDKFKMRLKGHVPTAV